LERLAAEAPRENDSAKALGLKVPVSMQVLADEVIE
jgi:hypothetical protein